MLYEVITGLCHSVIEDTMLMVLAGGHLSGILWGRLLFSMAATAVLVKLSGVLPEALFDRIFWHGTAPSSLRAAPAKAEQEACRITSYNVCYTKLLRENESEVVVVSDLVYSKVSNRPARWVLAVAGDSPYKKPEDLEGKKISYNFV